MQNLASHAYKVFNLAVQRDGQATAPVRGSNATKRRNASDGCRTMSSVGSAALWTSMRRIGSVHSVYEVDACRDGLRGGPVKTNLLFERLRECQGVSQSRGCDAGC